MKVYFDRDKREGNEYFNEWNFGPACCPQMQENVDADDLGFNDSVLCLGRFGPIRFCPYCGEGMIISVRDFANSDTYEGD